MDYSNLFMVGLCNSEDPKSDKFWADNWSCLVVILIYVMFEVSILYSHYCLSENIIFYLIGYLAYIKMEET